MPLRDGGEAGAAPLILCETAPSVILVVGVNGGGKTTTVGKLSHRFASESGAKAGLVAPPLFTTLLRIVRVKTHSTDDSQYGPWNQSDTREWSVNLTRG